MNDEDILLYARAFRGRNGQGALISARNQACLLEESGDKEGADAWKRVAGVLESLEGSPRDEIDVSHLR